MKKIATALLLLMAAFTLHAANQTTVGGAASNVNSVLFMVAGLIEAILYIAAVAMFVSAAMKYRIHRQNPQQIPISTPITELVLAIILGCLPYVSKMANEHLFTDNSNPGKAAKAPKGPSGSAPVPNQNRTR